MSGGDCIAESPPVQIFMLCKAFCYQLEGVGWPVLQTDTPQGSGELLPISLVVHQEEPDTLLVPIALPKGGK